MFDAVFKVALPEFIVEPFHQGQGALKLTSSLMDDLEITQLAFDLLCYFSCSITEQKLS